MLPRVWLIRAATPGKGAAAPGWGQAALRSGTEGTKPAEGLGVLGQRAQGGSTVQHPAPPSQPQGEAARGAEPSAGKGSGSTHISFFSLSTIWGSRRPQASTSPACGALGDAPAMERGSRGRGAASLISPGEGGGELHPAGSGAPVLVKAHFDAEGSLYICHYYSCHRQAERSRVNPLGRGDRGSCLQEEQRHGFPPGEAFPTVVQPWRCASGELGQAQRGHATRRPPKCSRWQDLTTLPHTHTPGPWLTFSLSLSPLTVLQGEIHPRLITGEASQGAGRGAEAEQH